MNPVRLTFVPIFFLALVTSTWVSMGFAQSSTPSTLAVRAQSVFDKLRIGGSTSGAWELIQLSQSACQSESLVVDHLNDIEGVRVQAELQTVALVSSAQSIDQILNSVLGRLENPGNAQVYRAAALQDSASESVSQGPTLLANLAGCQQIAIDLGLFKDQAQSAIDLARADAVGTVCKDSLLGLEDPWIASQTESQALAVECSDSSQAWQNPGGVSESVATVGVAGDALGELKQSQIITVPPQILVVGNLGYFPGQGVWLSPIGAGPGSGSGSGAGAAYGTRGLTGASGGPIVFMSSLELVSEITGRALSAFDRASRRYLSLEKSRFLVLASVEQRRKLVAKNRQLKRQEKRPSRVRSKVESLRSVVKSAL